LQRFIPVGIEHYYPDDERAVPIFLSVYADGIPHLPTAVVLY
jgi:hypothetical protein